MEFSGKCSYFLYFSWKCDELENDLDTLEICVIIMIIIIYNITEFILVLVKVLSNFRYLSYIILAKRRFFSTSRSRIF